MKVNGMREREMVMAFLQREMVITSRDIGLMTCEKARAVTTTMIRINFSLVNGLMTSLRQASTPR
jgi:hypothetical protein